MSKNNQYLFLGLLIIAGLTVLTIVNPGGNVEYKAGTDGGVATTSYSYDDFEIDSEGQISSRLEDANRQDGSERFGRRYLADSYGACLQAEFVCTDREQYFFDPYGCGCELLDFSPDNDNFAKEDVLSVPQVEVFGKVFTDVYGTAVRLDRKDSIELDNGDVTWIREFVSDDSGTPEAVFDVYLAAQDVTLVYPVEEDQIPYNIELVSSDYETYTEVIVTKVDLEE